MRTDKNEAFLLRKEGKTYLEIEKKLGVSRGTLSFWFKGFDWSSKITFENHTFNYSPENIRKMHAARRKQLDAHYELAEIEAEAEFAQYRTEALFIAGLMLYAGEGDRSINNSLLRIANSDYKIILVFKRFLENYYPEIAVKIRISVLVYPDLDQNECINWWSNILDVDFSRFHKPVLIFGKHKTKRLQHGVASLIISSKFFKVKVLKLLELSLKTYGLSHIKEKIDAAMV